MGIQNIKKIYFYATLCLQHPYMDFNISGRDDNLSHQQYFVVSFGYSVEKEGRDKLQKMAPRKIGKHAVKI